MGRFGQGKPQRGKKHKKLKAVKSDFSGREDSFPYQPGPELDRKAVTKAERQLPYKVREIMRLKEEAKSQGIEEKKKKKKGKNNRAKMDWIDEAMYRPEKGMERPIKPPKQFSQGEEESDLAFLRRMDNEAHSAIAKSRLEDKFEVELDEDDNDEITMKKKKKAPKDKKRLKRFKEKNKAIKEKRQYENVDEFQDLQDKVKFGEVAEEPPQLTAKPRKSDKPIGKAGAKSLLLSNMLEGKSTQKPKPTSRQVGKTMKRKFLSPAQQFIMDNEREKAIENYRHLKKRKVISYPGIE